MAESTEQEENCEQMMSSGSDSQDYMCQPCGGDKTVEAAGFCVDCSELLCQECFSYHPKPLMFKHHQLVDIEQVKNGSIAIHRDHCNKQCPEHRGKIIEYYCIDHEQLACGVCINLDHRTCTDVQYIPKVSESMAEGEECSALIRGLEAIAQRTKDIIKESKNRLSKSEDCHSKVIEDVKQVVKEAREVLEKMQKDIVEEAETKKTEHSRKMDENITSCDEIQNQAEKMASYIKTLKESGQHCNLFVAAKTEKENVKVMEEKLDQISDDNSIDNYLFKRSKQLTEFLKHGNVFGRVVSHWNTGGVVTKTSENCIKKPVCSIYGSTMLPNKRLCVADYTNKQIKVYDMNKHEVIKEFTLPERPWSIAKMSQGEAEIAATVEEKKIYLLKVQDSISIETEITTSSKCYALACTNDKLVVGLISPERLEIIDREGNVLQTIHTDTNGISFFECVYDVDVNSTTESVIACDHYKHTITSLSLTGEVQNIYQEKTMKEPVCAAIDKRGIVYVCWCDPTVICQYTPDFKSSNIIVSELDGLQSPMSMSYCEATDSLYVGQDNGTIQVYQLS